MMPAGSQQDDSLGPLPEGWGKTCLSRKQQLSNYFWLIRTEYEKILPF